MATLDWLLIVLYLALVVGIGFFFARNNRNAEDFLLGSRRLPAFALGLSLFATLLSTLSYLSYTGEVIAHGPMIISLVAAHPLIFLIVGYGLIPLLMRQPVTSAYEILETKLGKSIRMAGASIFLLLRLGWMATILYVTTSTVLIPLLRLDSKWTIPLCLGMGVVTAIYSSMGGLRAVVITDAIQSLTMLLGGIVALALITYRMGGFTAWWPSTWPSHWESPSWGIDPNARVSFTMLLISTVCWFVCTNGSDQMSIQRFLASRNAPRARRTLLIAQISDAIVIVLMAVTGMAVMAYYIAQDSSWATPDRLRKEGDQLFPLFIMTEMPPGLGGLVIAAILSAAMSSLSSGMNSACAVLDRDFLGGGSSSSMMRLRLLTWLIAAVTVLISLGNLLLTGNILERCYKVVNLLTVPLFILFFLALLVPWANSFGAWCGLIGSTLTAMSIAYSQELRLPISVSFVWMMPCSLVVGVVVGTLASGLAWLVQRGTRGTS